MMSIQKIKEDLKKKLSSKRYEHTMGVEYTSTCLAMRYGADIEKARLAGLLHDCAKYLSSEENSFCYYLAHNRLPGDVLT